MSAMLRISFHGRGGQGMKTASRMLGSAAFHAGYTVQDSPVYGAERRGAPMAAFTRVAKGPIRERGAIAAPNLVVVADDTLLTEEAAQPLAGCDLSCTALINTTRNAASVQNSRSPNLRILCADFTTLALHHTQTLAGLSTALSAAAAYLAGLSLEEALSGLADELLHAGLSVHQQQANEQLARVAYELSSAWPRLSKRVDASDLPEPTLHASSAPPTTRLVDVCFDPPARAAPTMYATANSPARKTGSWRQFRPVLDRELCTRCWICYVFCPEAAIDLDENEYPVVDYDVCKGCLLCAFECPTPALSVEKEMR